MGVVAKGLKLLNFAAMEKKHLALVAGVTVATGLAAWALSRRSQLPASKGLPIAKSTKSRVPPPPVESTIKVSAASTPEELAKAVEGITKQHGHRLQHILDVVEIISGNWERAPAAAELALAGLSLLLGGALKHSMDDDRETFADLAVKTASGAPPATRAAAIDVLLQLYKDRRRSGIPAPRDVLAFTAEGVKDRNVDVLQRACRCVFFMAADVSNREVLRSLGVVEAIMSALRDEGGLAAAQHEHGRQDAAQETGVTGVALECCAALRTFVDKSKQQIIDGGGVGLVISAMQRHGRVAELQSRGLALLAALPVTAEQACALANTAKKFPRHSGVLRAACEVLCDVTRSDPGSKDLLRDSGFEVSKLACASGDRGARDWGMKLERALKV
mmetsp:Transcript_31185/g.70147  ORF Transcript_31185/g.70147 Transcript_31185/m.70147 type:complete len:389 (+) Transcript_31185:1-1167(+)